MALVLIVSKSAFAQKDTIGLHIPYTDGNVAYERVVNAGKIPQTLLFSNANIWFMAHSNNNHPDITEDSMLYRIVAKYGYSITFDGILNHATAGVVNFAIQIDCKDGRYRCRIFNVTLQYNNLSGVPIYTNANGMMTALTGGPNNTGMNTNQLKRAFTAMNTAIMDTMRSLNKTMNDSNDF